MNSRIDLTGTPWQATIRVADIHEAYRSKRLNNCHHCRENAVREVAAELATRLEATIWAKELEASIRALRRVRTEDRYNALLEAIYDFGDRDKRLFLDGF